MIKYINTKPTVKEFIELRKAVNWDLNITKKEIKQSLDSSPYCIVAKDNDKVIGMVRVSGDKTMYGYIQDTIVVKEYRNKGVGAVMLKSLLEQMKSNKDYLLGVCPSKMSIKLYTKFGFIKRSEKANGFMYRCYVGGDQQK